MNKRRPIKMRDNRYIIQLAKWLSQKDVTPNQISLFSIVPAFIACLALAFWQASSLLFIQILLLIIALIGVQTRLLCNLIDGMVAIEGGKVTPAGELFNEVPDRVSDTLFFIGLGLATSYSQGFSFGLLAALFAALTAYIRVLGVSMGSPAFFSGPFAKQHRMATMSIAILITIFLLPYLGNKSLIFQITLWVIIIGSLLTCYRRLMQIFRYMNAQVQRDID